MVEDFRSEPSETPEGKGLARRAWEAYVAKATPAVVPLARVLSRKYSVEMIGFWVVWHAYGGFEGVHERYGMHPSTIWRKVAKFRRLYGVHPDEFRIEGVTIDTASFWAAAIKDQERRSK